MYRTDTGQKLPCRDARTVLTEFLEWLRKVARYNGGKVALVAYNGFRFDACILLYHFKK